MNKTLIATISLIMGAHAHATPIKAIQIAAGYESKCALLETGDIKCWGGNNAGQLGLGDITSRGGTLYPLGDQLPKVNLGTGLKAKYVTVGYSHACALLVDGSAKCWGDNSRGQLGIGDTLTHGQNPETMGDNLPFVKVGTGRTLVAIEAGYKYTCGILDNGKVKCWGLGENGVIGLGRSIDHGNSPATSGDNLPSVDLGTGRTAISIAVGVYHTCAILDDHSLKCWGQNYAGQLGQENSSSRGTCPGTMGDALSPINLGKGRSARQVAIGLSFTCALLDDSSVKCWGENSMGSLGLGNNTQYGAMPGTMGDALPTLELSSGLPVQSISSTWGEHTCALLLNNAIKCWGRNDCGKLGLGDTVQRGDAPSSMGDGLPFVDLGKLAQVKQVTAGRDSTCALLADGSVKCWGYNNSGELGLGDLKNRGTSPQDMGSALPAVNLGTKQ